MDDPNGQINIEGRLSTDLSKETSIIASVRNLNLSKLNITNKWKDTKFNFDINSNITYNHQNINPFNGNLAIKDFTMVSSSDLYTIKTISLNACQDSMSLQSDFGNIAINGQYNISTLAKSINNLLHEKLPTMFTEQPNVCNKFQIKANISNSEWVNRFSMFL